MTRFICNSSWEDTLLYQIVENLNSDYSSFLFVTAFAKTSGVNHIITNFKKFRELGGTITGIVGVDCKGTSIEALKQLKESTDKLYIIHNSNAGRTFHAKVYVFSNVSKAVSYIGSNNITLGGLVNNYEICQETIYDLTNQLELKQYHELIDFIQLSYINKHQITYEVTDVLLEKISSETNLLVSEKGANHNGARESSDEADSSFFGKESNITIPKLFSYNEEEGSTPNETNKACQTDPTIIESFMKTREKWLSAYYFNFLEDDLTNDRVWEDAVKYGFICAYNVNNCLQTLSRIKVNDLILVYSPSFGYIGAGLVKGTVVTIDKIEVHSKGRTLSIIDRRVKKKGDYFFFDQQDPNENQFAIPIEWVFTINNIEDALRPDGFYYHRGTVCRPTANQRWIRTVDKLIESWNLLDG